jgi:hypothetical protein
VPVHSAPVDTLNLDRVNAQQARRFLDRVVGYQVSPLLWQKVARGLSAGRVQSVAVRLIVDRDRFRLVSGEAELSSYRFNTGVANHLFCRHCGIHAFYIPRSDPDRVDVNVRCLDGVDLAGREFATFDGRNWEEAMQGHVPWR